MNTSDANNRGIPDSWEEDLYLWPRWPSEGREGEELEELQTMLEAGLITEEEYEKRKEEILLEKEGDKNRKDI